MMGAPAHHIGERLEATSRAKLHRRPHRIANRKTQEAAPEAIL